MLQAKNISAKLKNNLQAIPVCLTALVLWAFIGGWYVALAPLNLAGTDNIGIVLSTFGVCLFLADRLAFLWLRLECWVIIFKVWVWGLGFIAWGFLEWLHAFSQRYVVIFVAHWLTIALVIAAASLLVSRRRQQGENRQISSLEQMK